MLLFNLKTAPRAEKLILQAHALRKPVPEGAIPPPLYPWLVLFYKAFQDLVADRPTPDSPITWSARTLWAREHGLDEVQTELLHHHIQAMDIEFMKWRSEQQAQAAKRPGKQPPSGERQSPGKVARKPKRR